MFIAELSQQRIAGWNVQCLAEPEALQFCRAHQIYIVGDPREPYGSLVHYKGYNFILINRDLEPGMRLWVLWHEIGHFILHHPGTSHFKSTSMRRKNDREANYVAAVAMMPKPLIEGRTLAEIQKTFNYPPEIVQIRYEIAAREGI